MDAIKKIEIRIVEGGYLLTANRYGPSEREAVAVDLDTVTDHVMQWFTPAASDPCHGVAPHPDPSSSEVN